MERSGVEISQVGRQVQIRVCSSQVQAKAHCASAEECPHSLPFFCTHCFTINNHSCSISKHICVATQPTQYRSCYNVRPLFKCSGMLLEIVPAQQWRWDRTKTFLGANLLISTKPFFVRRRWNVTILQAFWRKNVWICKLWSEAASTKSIINGIKKI